MNAELNNNASIRVKDQQGNLKIKKREVFFLQKDEKKAILSLPGGVVEVDLDKIRLFLVGINLIILAAATVSYLAWMDAKYNWQINSDEQPGRNVLRCLDELPELENNQQMIFTGIHCYLDPMLYLSSFNLLIYWIIYGVFISARFGGFCDTCSVLMTLPHTLVIIIWEIGVAASIISVLFALKDLPWNELKEFSEQSYTDLRYIEQFYQRWGPWIAVLYILCFPVQISFVCLPFLMTRSPIETDSSSSKQITASNSTETPSQRGKDVVQGRYLIKIKEKFLDLLSKLINGSNKPTDNKQEIPTSGKRNDISDDSEYVCLEELDTSTADTDPELASLYQCEMPLEKLEHFKTQKLFSRVRRVSWRSGQTAGQAVLGTMQKVYHVHSNAKPYWSLLDKKTYILSRQGRPEIESVSLYIDMGGHESIYASIAGSDITYADMNRGLLTAADMTSGLSTAADITRGLSTAADITRGLSTAADITRGLLTAADMTSGLSTAADKSNRLSIDADKIGRSTKAVDVPSRFDVHLHADMDKKNHEYISPVYSRQNAALEYINGTII